MPDAQVNVIDWSPFDKYPEATCYCRCDTVYRSHAKAAMLSKGFMCVSRKPCPKCGKSDDILRISHDPEKWTV